MDAKSNPTILSETSVLTPQERSQARSLLRFITAQSIQIIEGAVVTHTNALSAFHDLKGVNVLMSRLSVEMDAIRQATADKDGSTSMDESGDVEMADADEQDSKLRSIHSSQRVLLFSIVNCLTVVFHQESGTATTSPLGGVQLRTPEMTAVVKEILDHVDSYGGVLAALVSSLLSDVMNSDPQVVHHVHGSGLAESFLRMLSNKDESGTPTLPPVAELIMALPSVLSAMSLTHDGATAVLEANPFPGLLAIFYNPAFAMPKSRCMLNEMTSIVGTGLDEVMRHVPRLRPLVMKAIVEAMMNVVNMGSELAKDEEALDLIANPDDKQLASLEERRTCLMQYATNFGQMLEQILHNEEHCEPFVNAGGLDAILGLFPCLMPSGIRFLSHVSCLSCPSVCTLTHSTTEDQLSTAFKCIALQYNSGNLVEKMVAALEAQLAMMDRIQGQVRQAFSNGALDVERALSAQGILENLPRVPLHDAIEMADFSSKAKHLSEYLRSVVTLQWLCNLFAGVLRAGCQRSQESGASWGRSEFQWKKKLFATPAFQNMMAKVAFFCHSSNLEVCRIRTQDGFEERDRSRLKKDEIGESHVRYRLRIVCQEGAVIRNGIEIDSCANVGTMDMGEVAEAFDRCVNSSGVMRYRTARGWVSELTRGHGREPIAEILSVYNSSETGPSVPNLNGKVEKQYNCGVSDVCSVGASILARLQNSYCELFSSLSRELVQSFKVVPARSVSFDPNSVGGYVRGLLVVLSSGIKQGFNIDNVAKAVASSSSSNELPFPTSDAGISMYLGAQLSHLQGCLFDDQRERRNLNMPLLIRLLHTDEGDTSTITPNLPFFLGAVGFVVRQSLSDFQVAALSMTGADNGESSGPSAHQSLSRSVAASLPPAIALMRRLVSALQGSSSALTSILERLDDHDRFVMMADGSLDEVQKSKKLLSYRPEYVTKALQCSVAETLLDAWKDPRLALSPAQVLYPVATLAGDVISSLDEALKTSSNSSESNRSESGQWELFSRAARGRLPRQRNDNGGNEEEAAAVAQEDFEPSEDTISLLIDMGFNREHALEAVESTRSNRMEIVMDYALSMGTLSPGELAARRAARNDARRRHAQDGAGNNGEDTSRVAAGQDHGNRDEEMADNESTNPNDDDKAINTTSATADGDEKTSDDSPDELMAKRIEECKRSWVENASVIAIDVISGTTDSTTIKKGEALLRYRDDGKGQGNAEAEALTVVLSCFLLELCQKYPEEQTKVVSMLLDRLSSLFAGGGSIIDGSWSIPSENARSFASLCHATVLCIRALSATRVLVLRKGIVRRLVSSLQYAQSHVQTEGATTEETRWPAWLPSGFLLLDVMAQPIATPPDGFDSAVDADEEFATVCEERKHKSTAIAQMADAIFSSLREHVEEATSPEERKPARGNNASDEERSPDVSGDGQKQGKPFSTVPPYFPLMTESSISGCITLCLDFLRNENDEPIPPPGIMQAVLSLLMRLLHSPKVASQCLDLGAAELLMSLPKACRFSGNAGISTIILRRLIEDEATLQASMASEIRHSITKLHSEKRRQESSDERPRLSTTEFVRTVTPLICREPVSFLKAAATTVCIEAKGGNGDSTEGSTSVVLLSAEQSARNNRVLSDIPNNKDSLIVSVGEKRVSKASNGKSQRRKSGSRVSKRPSLSKKNKRERSDSSLKKNSAVNGTPSNHVMCLLVSKVLDLVRHQQDSTSATLTDMTDDTTDTAVYGESSSFLWLADVLEIMANLVLAVPACAAAIHRYRTSTNKLSGGENTTINVSHALSGCPSPPRTFVNFLLHSILPQDRSTFRREQLQDSKGMDKELLKRRKKRAHMTTRVAQTGARLLVSLVARAGEGRRRVVADLAFALSGGHLGHPSSSSRLVSPLKIQQSPDDIEFHALQAWGELCIGLAAPRSNGSSNEMNSTLSFEVVKLMLDFGMAHALMYSIHRVHLQHPMATTTCASLLLPLEVFTRGSVTDAVQAIAEKELAATAKSARKADENNAIPVATKITEGVAVVSAGPSQRDEAVFADDAMLEDGFDAESAARSSRNVDDVQMEDAEGEYDMIVDNGESNDSDDDEMEVEESEEVDDEADSDDEEMSSDDDSGVTEDIEEDSDAVSNDEEDSSGESQEDGSDDDVEDQEGEDWEDGNDDDFLEGPVADEVRNEGGGEFEMDEGWTRIDANGFGGMLLGARRTGGRGISASSINVRSRGFIDAAEAMIGSLLRNGDLDGNALSEIEGTLGIRIVQNRGGLSETNGTAEDNPLFRGLGLRTPRTTAARSAPSAPGGVSLLPYLSQRSPPETGYTAMGGGGRWNEISSMEYIYGGPSIAAGSRNYDLSRSFPLEEEKDSYITPSQLDMRLFPGGPAAATHSRTDPPVHPLLCGVDLPPVNALFSDLLPHGIRAIRQSQVDARTSSGEAVRHSRIIHSTGGGPFGGAVTDASIRTAESNRIQGWSDDGLPFDATVADFSSSFERALGESMLAPQPSEESVIEEAHAQAPTEEASHEQDVAISQNPGASEATGAPHESVDDAEHEPHAAEPQPESAGTSNTSDVPNDGDGVASSLAAGLRLSPAREESASSDQATASERQPNNESQVGAGTEEDGSSPTGNANTDALMQVVGPEQQDETQGEVPAPMEEDENQVHENDSQAAGDSAEPASEAQQQEEVDESEGLAEGETLTCPAGMDQEVFNSLPVEMQREVVEQNQVAADVAGQLDAASGLDPEALAALPEEMRREVIEQDQRERRAREREQAPADPSNAEEMDNASFIASLAPDLREEILLTSDEAFLNSLPPNIIAEANILRERASALHRRANNDETLLAAAGNFGGQRSNSGNTGNGTVTSSQSRRRARPGKMKLECDRSQIVYLPSDEKHLSPLPGVADMKVLLRLLYLRSPPRPHRTLQKVFQNICAQRDLRNTLCTALVQLLNENPDGAALALETISKDYSGDDDWRKKIDNEFKEDFPPRFLIGATPETTDLDESNSSMALFRRRLAGNGTADPIAASLPLSAKGSYDEGIPPLVATTVIDTLLQLSKASPKICMSALNTELVGSELLENADGSLIFDKLMDLLGKPRYSKSSTNLEQLLNLIEIMVSPLSSLPRIGEEEHELSQRDLDGAASSRKEWVEVPRIVVSQSRLQLLCSILRMESCRDVAFTKVNSIARRLCRVEANRGYILGELGAVAQTLATDAIRDLRTLNIRMQDAVSLRQVNLAKNLEGTESNLDGDKFGVSGGGASSSVTLSISSSELKLLRVLQTLQSLCVDITDENSSKRDGKIVVTDQLVEIFRSMKLDDLWENLDSCLNIVKVLEGVTTIEEMDEQNGGNEDDDASDDGPGEKKLQNSVAGLLTRFLPIIEAFFVVNASFLSTAGTTDSKEKIEEVESTVQETTEDSGETPTDTEPATDMQQQQQNQWPTEKDNSELNSLTGGKRLVEFVQSNRVLLNALVRNNPGLLEKGLRSLVQVPRCRALLDFDVKRHWFKTQVRRLRQQASRRHGSLRLSIRRKYVFEDAYHQLRLRNADEMRGRLHITFRNEEGVDAGGLSREFFGILAKEIFNPNYALFTSTEDGCTFQPNPNSSINPDHLSYFRFVGRIVGKAVSDGFLLDAHFTRSLYKHMLGQKVSQLEQSVSLRWRHFIPTRSVSYACNPAHCW
jgi:hypothetical protein